VNASVLPFVVGLLLGAAATAVVLLVALGRARARAQEAATRTELTAARLDEEKAEAQGLARRLADDQARREAAERRVAALEQEIKDRERQLAEQGQLLTTAEKKLTDTFEALGTKALDANSERFLKVARQSFEQLLTESKGDSERRQQAIESLVKPIHEALHEQATAVGEIEKQRVEDKGRLEKQLEAIASSHEKLGLETGRLVSALRRPEQRGRWGELQLRNVVELAGMTERCDFETQATVTDGDSVQRPDLTVRLPGGGTIVIDAKVALDAYLDALQPDADRGACLKRHADQVEKHWKALAQKRYWEQFDSTPKLVVMFMPLESALVAALEVKPDLHADAMTNHVLVATPTLLVAMLRAVAYGWQQEAVAETARAIQRAGQELHSRLATFVGHLHGTGQAISKAAHSFNQAVGSLQAKVLPSARRMRELGATTDGEIGAPDLLDTETREVVAPEAPSLPALPADVDAS
jgi:DNA recombination protein RmuC